jgi:Protein of unknown function (DUF1580)
MPHYLSITQASQRLPGRPHRNTVCRWMNDGCYGVKLRSVRFGGKRLTTEEWCDEFVAAVQSSEPTPNRAHLEANAALDTLGV